MVSKARLDLPLPPRMSVREARIQAAHQPLPSALRAPSSAMHADTAAFRRAVLGAGAGGGKGKSGNSPGWLRLRGPRRARRRSRRDAVRSACSGLATPLRELIRATTRLSQAALRRCTTARADTDQPLPPLADRLAVRLRQLRPVQRDDARTRRLPAQRHPHTACAG